MWLCARCTRERGRREGGGTPAHLHAPGLSGERQLRHSALIERNLVLAGGEQAVRKGAVGAGTTPLHPDARAGGQPVLLLLSIFSIFLRRNTVTRLRGVCEVRRPRTYWDWCSTRARQLVYRHKPSPNRSLLYLTPSSISSVIRETISSGVSAGSYSNGV